MVHVDEWIVPASPVQEHRRDTEVPASPQDAATCGNLAADATPPAEPVVTAFEDIPQEGIDTQLRLKQAIIAGMVQHPDSSQQRNEAADLESEVMVCLVQHLSGKSPHVLLSCAQGLIKTWLLCSCCHHSLVQDFSTT